MTLQKRTKLSHKFVSKLTPNRKYSEDVITTSIEDVWRTITRSATDTTFVLCVLLCVWFQHQHYSNKYLILEKLRPLVSDKALNWIAANLEKLAGLSVFVVVFAKMRKTNKNIIMITIATAIYVLPKLNQLDYVSAAILVFLYTQCSRRNTRMTLIACSAIYIWYYYNNTNIPIAVDTTNANNHPDIPLKHQNSVPAKFQTNAETSRFAQKSLVVND